MKAFRFRLEFLQRFRRQKEEMAMYELAQRIRESNEIRETISRLEIRTRELNREIREPAEGCIPAPVFALYAGYLQDLHGQAKAAGRSLTRSEKRVEAQREKLVQASVDRKIMDRFKEIQYESHCEEAAREEQNLLDELAALAISRKNHES